MTPSAAMSLPWRLTGAVIAVGAAYVLRGPAKVEEASTAEGQPPNRVT